MFQKFRTATELLRLAIKVHFRTKFTANSTRCLPQIQPIFECDWNIYSSPNLLGRPREEEEMGAVCGMSVCRLSSASTSTAKCGYLLKGLKSASFRINRTWGP
jgi:hypothetical protein